jgi:hypothetical protein
MSVSLCHNWHGYLYDITYVLLAVYTILCLRPTGACCGLQVHFAAYRCMADCLMSDIQNEEAKYTNPSRPIGDSKRPKIDLSQGRDNWVTGCSAAAPRRDIRDNSGSSGSGQRHQNSGTSHRGSARGSRGRGSVASYRGTRGGNRGGYGRKVWGQGRWGSF